MKKVKFIRSLNVEDAILFNGEEVIRDRVYIQPNIKYVGEKSFINLEREVKDSVVPVYRLFLTRREDPLGDPEETYIAYSEEVEDLLETPFRVLKEEKDRLYQEKSLLDLEKSDLEIGFEDLRTAVRQLDSITLWDRIKYLFTCNKKHLISTPI